MPTYEYRCRHCGDETYVVQSIGEYSRTPLRPTCCAETMERKLSVVPMKALYNALANDRHYEGLRGPNGEDISSRAKHREFMKATGLTTVDDFRGHFAEKQREREDLRKATFQDGEIRQIVTEEVMKAVAKSD